MLDQYKTDGFPAEQLKSKGWDIEVVLKKGLSMVDSYDEANIFELRINGSWFLKQLKNKGNVRLSKLNKEQRKEFLALLRNLELYSKPDFALGIGLFLVYSAIVAYVFATDQRDIIEVFMPIAWGTMVCFLGLAYMRAVEILPDNINILLWILGIAAVVMTAPGSILNIPLVNAIYREALYKRVVRDQAYQVA